MTNVVKNATGNHIITSLEKNSLQRLKEQIERYESQVLLLRDKIEETDHEIMNAQNKLLQKSETQECSLKAPESMDSKWISKLKSWKGD